MRRLATVLLFAFMPGCGKKSSQGGVTVVVNVAPSVRARCISVVAAPASGGAEKSTEKVMRKDTLHFGVASGNGLEGEVRIVARGWLGTDCSGLNAESQPQAYKFLPGRASDTVTLEVTGALDDGDLDGYRALQAGGTDCKDDAGMVNPGADELCTNADDDDCNGLADCADSPRCDSVSCSDGQSCTAGDQCRNGTCMGNATACNTPPGECYRGPAACTDDGGCLFVVDAGTPCDGGSCRPDGTCAPTGTEADCTDGRDDDLDGLFDCLDVADCTTQLCTSTNLCSTMNRCVADGGCAGVARDCSVAPGECLIADAGACAAASGQCVWPVRVGTCNDGRACTAGDACGADGGCAGATVTCSTADDGGCFSPAGACVEPSGSCTFPPRGGFTCNDGNACSPVDTCSDAGTCAGAVYTCAAPAECREPGTCEGDGGCSFVQSAVGTLCDAGTCQANGGCSASLPAGPWTYQPSNFAPEQIPDSGIFGPLIIDCGNAVFDSTLGLLTPCFGQPFITARSLRQDGGPDVWLLPVSGLLVTDGGSLRLQGDRPVIFAVYGDAVIAGRLQANTARFDVVQGAGGSTLLNRARCGARAGGDGMFTTAGGGGGGGALVGVAGRGGDGLDAGGGDAGVNLARVALSPLIGGCPGGYGGGIGPGGGSGGGGAVQVSATGSVTVSGVNTVSGAGGLHGNFNYTGGGGAGSGGGVLLEGVLVQVAATARVTANGGGGGAGAGSSGFASDGENGSPTSEVPAAGGTPALGGERGGAGGAGDAGAGDGTAGVAGGGGGGGALGLLRINGYPGCRIGGGAVISAVSSDNGCN